jgi:FG-GAP-like repeat
MLAALLLLATLVQAPEAATAAAAIEAPPPARFFWADVDRDGLEDAFVITPDGAARFLRNEGGGAFADATERAGLAGLEHVTLAAFADLDGDGRPEALVGTVHGLRLFKNLGDAGFEDASALCGLDLQGALLHVGRLDVDGDGLPDLHLRTAGAERVYRNRGALAFEALELPLAEARATSVETQHGSATGDGDASAPGPSATDVPAPEATPARSAGGPSASVSGATTAGAPGAAARPSADAARAPDGGHGAALPGGATHAARPPAVTGTLDGGSQPLVTAGSGAQYLGPVVPELRMCAGSVIDQAGSGCIELSTVPVFGTIYPLGPELNIDGAGHVGIGTTSPLYRLHVETNAPGDRAIYAHNTDTSGQNQAVYALTDSPLGTALYAEAANLGGNTTGIYGLSRSNLGIGVYGRDNSGTGATTGVKGEVTSVAGTAVLGVAAASSGATTGVEGRSDSPDGVGVHAENLSDGTDVTALEAEVLGGAGTAVAMRARASTSSDLITTTVGVWASGVSSTGLAVGVFGAVDDPGDGPITSPATLGGVVGQSELDLGTGVGGSFSRSAGQGFGVYGESRSPDGTGVRGRVFPGGALSTGVGVHGDVDGSSAIAVLGENEATAGAAIGVKGATDSDVGVAVLGEATAASGTAIGVEGTTASPAGVAVKGSASAGTGVEGESSAANGIGVLGTGATGVSGVTSQTSSLAAGVRGEVQAPGGLGAGVEGISVQGPGVGGRFQGGTTGVSGSAQVGTGPHIGGAFAAANGSVNFGIAADAGTSSAGPSYGGYFTANGTSADVDYGVRGEGTDAGVAGYGMGASSVGVLGRNEHSSGEALGVSGVTISPDGTAVKGYATSTTGSTVGVNGVADSIYGTGVLGENPSGGGSGISGEVHTVAGSGLIAFGVSGFTIGGGEGVGVLGWSDSSDSGSGVAGSIGTQSYSVRGAGTSGVSELSEGMGVVGIATDATGNNIGVHGQSDSSQGTGVRGTGLGASAKGGYFEGGSRGVEAVANQVGTGSRYGAYFEGGGSDGNIWGVYAVADDPQNDGEAIAVSGVCSPADGLAGSFLGNVSVLGTLSKSGGSFKIDHPLDPENKYLYHSFVESPDMMNVYNGNTVLDADGEAWVELPEWFEALNSDFRYQLTAIGAPALLWIADEIARHRFRIAGNVPGVRVSWQVTGVRQDAWAEANRIPVEEPKRPEDRGRYLHPEVWGLPPERGIEQARALAAEREDSGSGPHTRVFERPEPKARLVEVREDAGTDRIDVRRPDR